MVENKLLVEICILNVLLVRAQKEMRSMLLKLEERRSLLHSGRELSCTMPYSYVETEFISNELSYLAEEIFKRGVESVPGFFLLLIMKYKRK